MQGVKRIMLKNSKVNIDKDQCFYDFFSEIQRSTDYYNHMTCNLDGVNYSSDSIRKLDFKNWRFKCNCKKEIELHLKSKKN
jgi:hypothetical protein